jgi:hypothetical protein
MRVVDQKAIGLQLEILQFAGGRVNGRNRRAPCKGGAFQWVQAPPGDSLQPEAIGAVMEVTKWLKPSTSGHNR